MAGRRILYAALLLGAAVLHIAYGQYVTHLILMFLIILPVISLLLAVPAEVKSRAELTGGEDVEIGSRTVIHLNTRCDSALFIPSAWKLRIERRNIFTGEKPKKTRVVFKGGGAYEDAFIPDTDRIGAVRCSIRRASVCDPLGLFALPVKKSGDITLIVLPREKAPIPEPDLIKASATVMRPKPGGFSEEHELRPYREGDSVNLIHWKLTVKMDEPIVREPQEVLYKNIILSADIPEYPEDAESVLGVIIYLGRKLNEEGVSFILHFGSRTASIRSAAELERFIREELAKPLKQEKAAPALEGSDTIVFRIDPGMGGAA